MDERHHLAVAVAEPPTERKSRGRSRQRQNFQPRVVDENRAAALLGVTAQELRRLSRETGLGRAAHAGEEEVVFTYAEIYRLCRSALQISS